MAIIGWKLYLNLNIKSYMPNLYIYGKKKGDYT